MLASPTAAHAVDPIVIPGLRSLSRRALPTILEAMLLPAVLLSVFTRVAGIWVGLGMALGWALLGIGRRVVTGRQVSGMLLLAALALSARTALAGITGNTDLYFIQPALGDAVVGLGFLGSLLTGGSLIQRLAQDVVPIEGFIGRPGVRQFFNRITLLWGLVLLLHAGWSIWLLLNSSVETYVMARPAAAIVVKAATVGASAIWFRATVRRRGLPLVVS
jgi:hypothetical protein